MNDVTQKGNVVHGDQSGRDLYKVVPPRPLTPISGLYERLRLEAQRDQQLHGLIEALEHYTRPLPEPPPATLEDKLEAGDRRDKLRDAVRKKELVAKRIARHNLSEAAQMILLYVLGRALQYFDVYVKPHVGSTTASALDKLLLEDVVNRILEELEDNALCLSPDEVEGLVWYLTGHCFIRWTSDANVSSRP